eukprot:TRINITY_DN9_c0_g2_i1.p1 TRINITY_DN9_c0_g2~~TRINITY_DN9_c0_g2_i1.p1  ORF type:complete len:996 (+),score=348.05 TRINITY_DN9_c0_g2_i1:42-3029(+)
MKRRKTSNSRSKSEEKCSISNDLLLQTLELAKEGFLIVSKEKNGFKLTHWNRSALKFLFCRDEKDLELECLQYHQSSPQNEKHEENAERVEWIGRNNDSSYYFSPLFWNYLNRCLRGEKTPKRIKFRSKGKDEKREKFGFYFLSLSFFKYSSENERECAIVRMEGEWHELPMTEQRILSIDEQQWMIQLMNLANPNALMVMWHPIKKDLFLCRSTPQYDECFFKGVKLEAVWAKEKAKSNEKLGILHSEIEWWGSQYTTTIGSENKYEVESIVHSVGDLKDRIMNGKCTYIDSQHLDSLEFGRNKTGEIDGFTHRFIVTFEDVTEKREIQKKSKEMQEINEMQYQFMNSCSNAMELLELLPSGHVKYHLVNDACQKALESVGGFNARGKTSEELGFPLDHVKMYSNYMIEVEETGESIQRTHHDPRMNNWYSISCWKASSNLFGIIVTDVSQVKRLEQELVKSKERLEDQVEERTKDLNLALAVRSRFLATMSHEVRTPLSGIMSCLHHFLELDGLSADSKEMMKIGMICSEQLLVVINDVLDFSKIDAHEVTLDIRPCHLQTVIEESMEVVSIQASKKNIPLFSRSETPLELHVVIDQGRLRQILINLLANATKFTDEGEIELSVDYEWKNGKVVLHFAVRDTGIGISEDSKEKIFLPFLQSDTSITRRYGGSGLGLCIVKKLVEMMKGNIQVESKLGEGSRFFFSIEVDTVENTDKSLSILSEIGNKLKRSSEKKKKNSVILVNSSKGLLSAMRNYMMKLGIECISLQSCEQAIKLDESKHSSASLYLVDNNEKEEDLEGLKRICDRFGGKFVISGKDEESSGTIHTPFRKKDILILLSEAILGEKIVLEKEKPKQQQTLEGLRVLVAEDNILNQKVIHRMLKRLGIEPVIVENGKLAVEQAMTGDYHLILMDCMMPIMGGIEATQQIRKMVPSTKQPKIVALTADAMSDHKKSCLENGMDEVLTKPINQNQLFDELCKVYVPPTIRRIVGEV